jgi:manganese/zinc/iron transport system ATP- binding protein
LIKAAMGLVPLKSGFVEIFGKSLDTMRQRVSYVPQRESVDWDFPISVKEVVEMGRLPMRGILQRLRPEDKTAIAEALDQVQLAGYADRQISQLSGGQQQRVFIARALAQQPDFFFLDEPFAGVDVASEEAIIGLLKSLCAAGKTIVVVHHDLQTVPAYFSHAVLLNSRLIAAGPVTDVFTQENLAATYGARLTILANVEQAAQEKGIDIR